MCQHVGVHVYTPVVHTVGVHMCHVSACGDTCTCSWVYTPVVHIVGVHMCHVSACGDTCSCCMHGHVVGAMFTAYNYTHVYLLTMHMHEPRGGGGHWGSR